MPIATDLQAIADSANRDLDAAHDYYVHSKTVWQSFRAYVGIGHNVSSTNPATGTTADVAELVRLAPQYARDYLATFTLRQFVATFESFFFAFYHRVLRHNPWPFGKAQVPFQEVLEARDRDEVIAGVLFKQLNELKYKSVRDWFDTLNRTVKLDYPTGEEADALAELKAARDILEHNAGVANDTYVRKAGKAVRYAAGDLIEIDDDYHLASWQLLKRVVAGLTAAAVVRLTEP